MAQYVAEREQRPSFGPPPTWITGWSPTRHPVRHRVYRCLEAVLARGPERFDGAAPRMRQRVRNTGPEAVFDRSRPTICREP